MKWMLDPPHGIHLRNDIHNSLIGVVGFAATAPGQAQIAGRTW